MSSSTSSDIVIQAKHLGKAFQLYARRNDWLKQVMFGWWKSYFKPFTVLRDINFQVHRGESIGFLVRNGCGKSTLLQVICGMTLPSHSSFVSPAASRRCWRSARPSIRNCRVARTS